MDGGESPAGSSDSRKRKAHSKSRNGCLQCKRRHHKCDEVHPKCGHCRRLGTTCSLESPATTPRIDDNANEQALPMEDLRLLSHWLIRDPMFGDEDQKDAKKQQRHIMDMAFTHPYLLHTILSISALDLFAHNTDNKKYYYQASEHNLAAIRKARPNITRSDAKHGEALFTFSALSSLYAFAEPPLRILNLDERNNSDCIEELLNSFQMGRGNLAVIERNKPHLTEAIKPFPEQSPVDHAVRRTMVEEEYPQLLILKTMVEDQCADSVKNSCLKALDQLFEAISELERTPKDSANAQKIMIWSSHLDSCFLKMIEAKDPVAMVILTHYAVMVNTRSNIWFFGLWPALLLETIEGLLGSEWEEYLEWPRSKIFDKKKDADMTE